MILFFADGRLGNQIFQYAFLNTIAKKNDEQIIVSGFEELKEVFEINDIINLNKKNRWLRVFLHRICKPIFCFLSNKKIISSISVNHEHVMEKYRREMTTYSKNKGFFTSFTFVKLGFFQSEAFFDKKIVKQLIIKEKYLNKANNFLKSIPSNQNKIFIHIRRGDYKNFPVYGKSTLLPISYYKEQINWFLKNKEKCFFVFLSDEPEFVKKEFKHIDNKLISSDNSVGVDLAIMTLCNNAILSPSSFGWWGSYLMKNRDVVFAPKYWLGFNSELEYHKNSDPVFAKKITI